jgi:hypothetical protein
MEMREADMNELSVVEAIQNRMEELGRLLSQVAENREAVAELAAAYAAREPERFKAVLERTIGFPFPADKCDPYVRGFILVIEPPKFVRVCTWVEREGVFTAEEANQIVDTVSGGAAPARMLEALERMGFIKCEWVRRDRTSLVEIDKFVQGMCPPGTA